MGIEIVSGNTSLSTSPSSAARPSRTGEGADPVPAPCATALLSSLAAADQEQPGKLAGTAGRRKRCPPERASPGRSKFAGFPDSPPRGRAYGGHMPELMVKTYASRGAPGLAARRPGGAAAAAGQASESADYRSASCAGPAAAPNRPAVPLRHGSHPRRWPRTRCRTHACRSRHGREFRPRGLGLGNNIPGQATSPSESITDRK
jgi:hypothetical protein